MEGARRVIPIVLAVAAFVATGTAQRRPMFATVVGVDGAAIEGADVCAVSSADGIDPGETDVVRTRTDERGRAICRVLPGRIYEVWALGPADAAGRRAATMPRHLVTVGGVIELRAAAPRAPTRVRLRDLAAWRDVGAAAMRWYVDRAADAHVELPLPAKGVDEISLATLPTATGALELVDARGTELVAVDVEPRTETSVFWPAPVEVTIDATDADGEPARGTTIFSPRRRRHGGPFRRNLPIASWAPIGRTDERGRLTAYVAGKRTRITARAEGRALSVATIDAAAPTRVELATPTPGAFLVTGDAARGATLAAYHSQIIQLSPTSSATANYPLECVATRAGRWSLPGGALTITPTLSLVGEHPSRVACGIIPADEQPARIDLVAMQRVDVRVRDERGNPTACALALVAGPNAFVRLAFATDLSGAAELRVPPGEWLVYATDGARHGLAPIDATSDELPIRLEPIPTMRVVVKGPDGAPVAGAYVSETRGRSSGRPSHSRAIASAMWAYYARQASSDRDGVLEIPTIAHESLTPWVRLTHERLTSGTFELEPGGSTSVLLH